MLLAAADVSHHASRPAIDPRTQVPIMFHPVPAIPVQAVPMPAQHFALAEFRPLPMPPPPAMWYGTVTQRKAKKTWGERLRLPTLPKLRERWKDRDGPGNPARMAVNYGTTKQPTASNFGTVTSQSALAKSMEYAEPWLYGTYGRSSSAEAAVGSSTVSRGSVVAWSKPRGATLRSRLPPGIPEAEYEEIASPVYDLNAILCACKTASHRSRSRLGKDCKRCGSTRGSIRRSTTNGRKSKGRSRPSLNSVLSTDEDPYSFMRQARMLTGASSSQGSVESFSRPATLAEEEECSYQEFPDYISATKNRFATVQSIRSAAKSSRANITSSFSASALGDKTETGSVRGRRDRDASSPVNGAAASAASSWDAGSFGEEEFFDASDRLSNGIASPPRKSILECSVNAYDLMKRLAKPDLLGYDSGSDELSDNALTLDHDPISSRSTKDFKQVDHAVVSGLRSLRNGPPSYQLLSDGEGEEVSTSSECTVNTSSSNSLYGIGTMSSNSNAGSVDDGPDYAKISDHDVQVIQPPLPPPLPDRLLTKQLSNSDGAPPPPPLPPPPPPFPLGLGARRDSNESDTSSGVSDDSDAPKRPPRHKRSIGMADRPAAMMKRVSSCDSVSKVLGNQQDAVISQLKSILKKPLLQPVARSHNAPDKATVDKDREESSKSAPRRSDSADELEHHFKHRKKKQVQFRSSADITVLSQDSSSGDDFSEELESELESIFKRMKLNSRWALPSKPEDDVQPEEASKAHSEDDQQGEDESPSPPEVQPSVPESQADEDVPSSEEETTFFSTVVVRTPSEDETFRGNGSTHFRRGAIRRSLSDRPSAAKSAVFNDTMRLRLGTGRKTIIDVFSSASNAVVEQPAASPTEAVATTSSDLENAATKKLVEYFSTKTTKRPKVPPPPPPPPRNKTMKAPTTVTVTLGPNGGDSSEDSGNYSMGTVKSDGPSDEPSSVGVNSSPVMESSATAGASVNNDGSASSTSNNPLADYQLSSFDDSQSKNVLAPTGGPTASNPMSNSSATSDGSATSAIIERYKKAAIRITTCGTIESPAEVVECDYTVSDSSHVGEGQEPGPTCITISATRRSCLSNILVIKNEMDDQLTCRGATGFSGDDDDLLQKDLDEVEALYEEISEPIYEEVMNGDPSKSTALEYEQCLKRCLLGEDQNVKSLFDGASRDEILTYLEGVRDRATTIAEEEDSGPGPLLESPIGRRNSQNRISNMSSASDSSSDDSSTRFALSDFLKGKERRGSVEVERNDSGVGSETSKPSLSRRAQHGASQALPPGVRPHRTPKCCGDVVSSARMVLTDTVDEDHMCEDCDQLISSRSVQRNADGFVPLTCWKCRRRRQERKELIMEIVETEMKYGRDLHIIQEEFYRPMLVAGLLTADQLAGVFLNLPELRDWNRRFTDRLRDALEIALEHGDEDLLTVNLGRLFFQAAPMLHAFETYCLRQGTASVLLSNMEKEKELLRIFLKVSQMENTLLRRMNLSSFLMVPVQRVTKYPLLLGRLYKVTPHRLEGREAVREAQRKIEAHLEHINSEAKELSSTKLWRRISIISASSSVRRLNTTEADQQVGNIRLRKLALDILEWSADSVCFAMEGKLSFTQAGDNMWTRRGRNVKLTPTYAVLVIKGNLTSQYNPAAAEGDVLFFARRKGIEQAALLLARERNNTRYSLIRDPLMLDKCIISSDTEVEGYFEVHDHSSKETIYFKADTPASSSLWFRALQYHCHSLGHWRRRRNALANIMIDGMGIDKSQC